MDVRRARDTATRALAGAAALLVAAGLLPASVAAPAQAAPAGAGFSLNASDLRFILRQIKVAEAHATTESGPGTPLLGSGPDQVPNVVAPYGLRTVDGSENNLQPGQAGFGSSRRAFPRLTTPTFSPAEDSTVPGVGPVGPPGQTSYAQRSGSVVDSEPRVVSNLVVDQTAANPAAVAAARVPPGSVPPASTTLAIPNVTTDVGLSPPYNSWFTLFGQFFDHGLDSTRKGGSGTVFVPLREDDPLVAGPDRASGTTDDLPAGQRFMVLTRATNQPGPDGKLGTADDVHDASNTDTPWVDLSQAYASHASHQVFLRAYENDAAGRPVSTGELLEGPDGGMPTWATVRSQAATLLGIELSDADVQSIPLLATDEYGRFLRGARGLPQVVTASGLVEGDVADPVAVPADAVRIGIAFLDDIAHNAVPKAGLAPDGDDRVTGAAGSQPAGTYDDEMLAAHYVAGDGRVNENIGLTAVHQVFHSEHNRLVDDIKNLVTTQGVDVPEWQPSPGVWNGERLFQAARFVDEMEYQHIAFEEFARKVQPAIDPFSVYQTDIDPAISAEFAHAVYRFGHSMLTDTLARRDSDGTRHDMPLLDAFLNPPSFTEGGAVTPRQAVGSIVAGMTEQVGSELDEFVSESLRNNLLGLPLDLATLNIARARETGVPPLNETRDQLFRATGDSSLRPYSSWVDFGLALKHRESVVNFMAAYGLHPTITGATTLEGSRAAARLIYENDPVLSPDTPADSEDFVNSTGAWANGDGGASRTGVDDVDLWVGGLAEAQNLFGGLLGSTFNYVFETQMADLQNGDRFYYLWRTAGLNLRSQLEGNSFAELVMRNSDARALKADVFATADCTFELGSLGTSGAVADDPQSECDEGALLVRMPDGTIRYRTTNTVDAPGLNGQSTFNGTPGDDRLWGGVDNDTFWGNEGADRIEGADGNDTSLGGDGNDVVTDAAGDDVLKGGDGNDALDGGPGLDLLLAGNGKDFVGGGANTNETFGGQGDDFVIAGGGADTVFGEGGDDWVEGGDQADLLQGDSGAPFFDDVDAPGHDILVGQGGDDDYDAEGGDDIMVAGPGIERNAGMRGFDWVTHVGDPQPADADLERLLVGLPVPVVETRDRFAQTEALSGWDHDDVLRGDDVVPSADDVLDGEGVARIAGLGALLPDGATSFRAGNILLGGAGSDLLGGRGADDVLDGDAWLDVRLSVRTDPRDPATEVRSARSLPELQPDLLAGRLDPGLVVAVREVLSTPGPDDVDTAVFSGARSEYTVTDDGGVLTVSHAGGTGADGTDTLRHVERLRFSDQTVSVETGTDVLAPGAVEIGTATAGNRSATVTWTAPSDPGASPVTGYRVEVLGEDAVVDTLVGIPAGATSTVAGNLTPGATYRFRVCAVNSAGCGPWSAPSDAVRIPVPVTPPAVTARTPAGGATAVAGTSNVTATFSEPVTGVTATTFTLRNAATGAPATAVVYRSGTTNTWVLNPSTVLAPGTRYTATLSGGPAAVRDLGGAPLVTASWSFTTAPAANAAPRVVGRAPAPGATAVGLAANVTATFSEPVAGVGATTFVLRTATTGAAVRALVSRDGTTNRYVLDPSQKLARNTRYTVTITGGTGAVRDLAGAPLVTTGWSFTTLP
jgi:Ca2+-binding RTX toxin-like protein